jgi:hypothetical protein
MSETARRERDPFTLALAFGLMAAAFAGSYTHVVHAVSDWGQEGWMSYAIAAMPEVTVIIGMRKVLTGTMTSIMWVFLVSAGLFTLAGNLNSSQHSIGGVIAAAWPAWSAVGALIFAGVHSRSRDAVEAASQTRTATEVTFRRGSTTAAAKAPQAHRGTDDDESQAKLARMTPSRDLVVVTPKAVTATRTADPDTDPVALALAAAWTPGQPLTREIKMQVMTQAQTSESTVKRTARALAARVEVTS